MQRKIIIIITGRDSQLYMMFPLEIPKYRKSYSSFSVSISYISQYYYTGKFQVSKLNYKENTSHFHGGNALLIRLYPALQHIRESLYCIVFPLLCANNATCWHFTYFNSQKIYNINVETTAAFIYNTVCCCFSCIFLEISYVL